MDWPPLQMGITPRGVISPFNVWSIGSWAGATPVGAAWPAANRAIYVPFVVNTKITIRRLGWFNGGTASGNVDVGIYDYARNRLSSTGSTAQSGINVIQIVDITDIVLTPGYYWMAMAMDNTTGTVQRAAGTNLLWNAGGLQQQTSAFVLPASATFENPASAFLPFILPYLKTAG